MKHCPSQYVHAVSIIEQGLNQNICNHIAAARVLPRVLERLVIEYAAVDDFAQRLFGGQYHFQHSISDNAGLVLDIYNGYDYQNSFCSMCGSEVPHLDIVLAAHLAGNIITSSLTAISITGVLRHIENGVPIKFSLLPGSGFFRSTCGTLGIPSGNIQMAIDSMMSQFGDVFRQ